MPKWTENEIVYLKEHYANESWDELLNHLNYEKGNIISKACKLKLSRTEYYWNKKDKEKLRECYKNKMPVREIKEIFKNKYSTNSIYTKAHKMQLIQKQRYI